MIPEQIAHYPLIKVCRPNCKIKSHGDCRDPGKRPTRSTNADRPITEIRRWIEQGGNYGIVPRSENDLLILDSDSDLFAQLVRRDLPETFTVKTGSGNHHFYYNSPYSGNQTFKDGSDEFGSIRTDNWHCVGPGSIHPETGQEYTVYRDKPLTPIPEAQLSDFVENVRSTELHRKDSGGGGSSGGGGGGGGSLRSTSVKASDLDNEPTKETLKVLKFVNSDSRRKQIAKTLDHSHPPRHVRVWACSFLYNVCGLTQRQLERLLNKMVVWATDSDRVETEVRSLVQESIPRKGPPQTDESVNLDRYLSLPDDSGERGTPDEGKPRSELSMSEGATFEEKESIVELNDDGGAVQARLMQGTTEDGEQFEYVDLATGNVEETKTVTGETVRVPNIDDGPGEADSIGSPDSLDAKIEALQQLKEQIE